jgi:biopolymer transport protein ExbB/TolQ
MSRHSKLAILIWVIGLVVGVPLAVYYLLFWARREEYALLIAFIIGWPFLYWSVVGPILLLLKARAVYRSLQQVTSLEDLRQKLSNGESEDEIVALIAGDNHIPKWLARRVYRYLLRVVATSDKAKAAVVE